MVKIYNYEERKMQPSKERILILCKTYPSPSAKYAETSCVAGMREDGSLIRLYPVPFRLINDNSKFKKWQWITARIARARDDRRIESHRIFVDTIECDVRALSTNDRWQERRSWLSKLKVYDDFVDMERARITDGQTLALLRPSTIRSLEIRAAATEDWTDAEKSKLLQMQNQGSLFDNSDKKEIALLRKIPHDFHYKYSCTLNGETHEYRHKIVDWEAGALYWKVRKSSDWEKLFRAKLEEHLPSKDLLFLMGTIHRFPDQWLIVSLIYPPKQQPSDQLQGLLL